MESQGNKGARKQLGQIGRDWEEDWIFQLGKGIRAWSKQPAVMEVEDIQCETAKRVVGKCGLGEHKYLNHEYLLTLVANT